MKYLVYGNQHTARKKTIDSLVKKMPIVCVLDDESFSFSVFEEHTRTTGLFTSTHVVLVKNVLENSAFKKDQEAILDLAGQTPHHIIFEEREPVSDGVHKKFTIEERYVCHQSLATPHKKNIFVFADTLGEKEGKYLWLTYQKMRDQGMSTEEIFQAMRWKVKMMLLVAVSGNNKTGLKPFVEQKAKKGIARYGHARVRAWSWKLCLLHHQSRQGVSSFEESFEGFLLDIANGRA